MRNFILLKFELINLLPESHLFYFYLIVNEWRYCSVQSNPVKDDLCYFTGFWFEFLQLPHTINTLISEGKI